MNLAEIQARASRENAEDSVHNLFEKQKQIELHSGKSAPIARTRSQLVQKAPDAERYKVETLANAKKFSSITEDAGAVVRDQATRFCLAPTS